jgi:hypothetical protein
MKYKQSQIKAVRDLKDLHEIEGNLTDEACEEYIDWHLATCSAKARGITTVEYAEADGLQNGLTILDLQFRKLSSLLS